MAQNKERTVHNLSVAADSEQSTCVTTDNIVSFEIKNINSNKKISSKNELKTLTLNQLLDTQYPPNDALIEGLLYRGTYILAGLPKVGKSFLAAQFAGYISFGSPLWGLPTCKGEVLYLALEDVERRLQERMARMFGYEGNDNLYFATAANSIEGGLSNQIEDFIKNHPKTKLIVIDVLQKIRDSQNEGYSYNDDYKAITALKRISDLYDICIVVVHHVRKQGSTNSYDRISGTNGLLGAADGAFILERDTTVSDQVKLNVVGRDQPELEIKLKRNLLTLAWELVEISAEQWKAPLDPVIVAIDELLTNNVWEGYASDLVAALQLEIQANQLMRRININETKMKELGIKLESRHNKSGRLIKFTREI